MAQRRRKSQARRPSVPPEVEALHRRCGVYTKPEVVRQILDGVGWTSSADLGSARLLEPASGDGAFVVEAARRLVQSHSKRRRTLSAELLAPSITAFELHPGEAERARENVIRTLRAAGIHHQTAAACAKSWVIAGDFLLSKIPASCFTHTVGNPPYVRWSRIPSTLKKKYESHIKQPIGRGDLFVPFLDKALESLTPSGRCGFICSDRWRYMAFAEGFRQKWVPNLEIESESRVGAESAFVRKVDSYPTILIASRTETPKAKAPSVIGARDKHTLGDLGFTVKVGPALGHTAAFVLQPDDRDVEPSLLKPWIDGSEIAEGTINWSGRQVLLMHDEHGALVDLKRFPRAKARLQRFRSRLKLRSIVSAGAEWYRPIDRVMASSWSRPKLLIPELAKTPRLAIDLSGAVPSHGVYAIFANDDNVTELYEKLAHGGLARRLEGIAPRVKGGYVRCYRRFLLKMQI